MYLDGGPCPGAVASTIIDLTGSVPRLLRAGAIPMDRLREVAALVTGEDMPASGSLTGAADEPAEPGQPNGTAQPPAKPAARHPLESTPPAAPAAYPLESAAPSVPPASPDVTESAPAEAPVATEAPMDTKAHRRIAAGSLRRELKWLLMSGNCVAAG